ncbi:MAG: GTP 3',8-cyclase MoaA [Planctomycetes bacterium]|nr:GTP 3',8-cyclase MoaA [Planctomycetota bacterium]
MSDAPIPRLVDRYGREVTDIRVSVTRRCNFRCVYCHDEGQGPVLSPGEPSPGEMAPSHIERILRVAAQFGIVSVKFTGGEPLVRSDIVSIVRGASRHLADVSMTTNGALLAPLALPLREAGLGRINVSVDSLDPEAFREIRRGRLLPVLRGIRAALAAGLSPVKLNMVVMKRTLPYLADMIRYVGESGGLQLQLIQYMPELVGQKKWMADIDEVKEALAGAADRIEVREMHHRNVYHVHGARVEVVDPVHNREFCFNCRRMRVTYDGMLKGCLNRDDDLVPTAGLSDDGIRDAFRRVVAARVPYYGVHVTDDPERRDSTWPSERSPKERTSAPERARL